MTKFKLFGSVFLIASASLIFGATYNVKSDPYVEIETETLERTLTNSGFSLGQPVFIRIFKESNELEVWIKNGESYNLFKTYEICTYSGSLGPKLIEGDLQSPEGFYTVKKSQLKPNSDYHLAFNIGFPNAYDRAHDRTGSFIMVHGDCVSIGCYAMTDEGIEEIYALAEAALKDGQASFQVHIYPFRMNSKTLALHQGSKWYEFWSNLKTGYDLFEKHHIVPIISISNKTYIFSLP